MSGGPVNLICGHCRGGLRCDVCGAEYAGSLGAETLFFNLPENAGLPGRGVLVEWGEGRVTAGLDQDFAGQPFDPVPQLLAIADVITKTLAVCMVCGAPANRTQRLTVVTGRIAVGGAHEYEARCRRCHVMPATKPLPA